MVKKHVSITKISTTTKNFWLFWIKKKSCFSRCFHMESPKTSIPPWTMSSQVEFVDKFNLMEDIPLLLFWSYKIFNMLYLNARFLSWIIPYLVYTKMQVFFFKLFGLTNFVRPNNGSSLRLKPIQDRSSVSALLRRQ